MARNVKLAESMMMGADKDGQYERHPAGAVWEKHIQI